MSESPFVTDFRVLLAKHNIAAPKFAHGSKPFNPAKPQCLYGGPVYDVEELAAATGALCEGKWSVSGEYVHRFEKLFSEYLGQEESVAVNSGSSADLLMIAAAKARYGWDDGDGILVSPCGFPTTISAITLNGLTPVFVDIEWETLNADHKAIETKLIYDCPAPTHIKAIFVSPVLGNPPDMDELVQLGERYGVKILLDGCDSLGSKWRGKHLAHYAAASSCSFFPAHHMSVLNGGMISSNDKELVRIARQLSTWGRGCHCVGAANLLSKGTCGCRFKAWLPDEPDLILDHKYVFERQGYNLQMLDLQGAMGCAQMAKLESIHERRRAAWLRIRHALVTSPLNVRVVNRLYAEVDSPLPSSQPSWFGVAIVCRDYAYKRALVSHLEAAGIQTRNMFAENILQQPGYAHLGTATDYPNANQVPRCVFFLGCPPFYSEEHFAHIESTLRSFVPPS